MSKERRKYERFSLRIIAKRITEGGREVDLEVKELSVGGCFVKWFEEAAPGYTFEAKFPLVNNSWTLLQCKVRYRYMTLGVGIQFIDITYGEQELLAELIMNHLWREGLPEKNPFDPPEEVESAEKIEEF